VELLKWQKSSYSVNGIGCVEIAKDTEGGVYMRDSKDKGEGPMHYFNRSEWTAFLAGAKAGEFDTV
jgi:hypothetical protein